MKLVCKTITCRGPSSVFPSFVISSLFPALYYLFFFNHKFSGADTTFCSVFLFAGRPQIPSSDSHDIHQGAQMTIIYYYKQTNGNMPSSKIIPVFWSRRYK